MERVQIDVNAITPQQAAEFLNTHERVCFVNPRFPLHSNRQYICGSILRVEGTFADIITQHHHNYRKNFNDLTPRIDLERQGLIGLHHRRGNVIRAPRENAPPVDPIDPGMPLPFLVSRSPSSTWSPPPPIPESQYLTQLVTDTRPSDDTMAREYDLSNNAPFHLIADDTILANTRGHYIRMAGCLDALRQAYTRHRRTPITNVDTRHIENNIRCVKNEAEGLTNDMSRYYNIGGNIAVSVNNTAYQTPHHHRDIQIQENGNANITLPIRDVNSNIRPNMRVLETLVHNWMHFRDHKALNLTQINHTPGFRDRSHFLFKQITGEVPYDVITQPTTTEQPPSANPSTQP